MNKHILVDIIMSVVLIVAIFAFITVELIDMTKRDTVEIVREVEKETPNFAVIVDDDAQECYIVVVLDVIEKNDSIVIVTASADIKAKKEEVIFCKTYSEAETWLQIVSGLNG